MSSLMDPKIQKAMDDLFEKYYPIEVSPTISTEDKIDAMEEAME